MDINFDCIHCGHNISIDESAADSTIECPSCYKLISVPEKPKVTSPSFTPQMMPQVVGTPANTPPQRAPAMPTASTPPPQSAPAMPAASDAVDKHIRNAWIAAAVPAVFYLGRVIRDIPGLRDPLETSINGRLMNVVLLLGLAFGVAKHSRICAVGLVLYWSLGMIMTMIMMGSKLGAVAVGVSVDVIFLYFFVRGAIATFEYHPARPAVTRASASHAQIPHFMRPLVDFIFPRQLHRIAYFCRLIAVNILFVTLYANSTTMDARFCWGATMALGIYGLFFVLWPRLRDVGMSGWWLVPAFIPFVAFFLGIILMFRPPEYHYATATDAAENET